MPIETDIHAKFRGKKSVAPMHGCLVGYFLIIAMIQRTDNLHICIQILLCAGNISTYKLSGKVYILILYNAYMIFGFWTYKHLLAIFVVRVQAFYKIW